MTMTRRKPVNTPGSDRGSVTFRDTFTGEAPSEPAASSNDGSSLPNPEIIASTAYGTSISVKAMIVPVRLLLNYIGASIRFIADKVSLMTPWFPRIAIQPYVLVTAEVRRGAITRAIKTPFHVDRVVLRKSASG